MLRLSRKHRWFGVGFLLAWAISHGAAVNAQIESKPTETRPNVGDKIRRTLDQTITLDYAGQSFNEAINHLKERTQLPVVVDQFALQNVGLGDGVPCNIELRNSRGKVRNALQHLLHSYNLTYVVLEDCLLITSEETAVTRQMRQRFPVDVKDVPAATILRDLARQAGISLVIDPRLGSVIKANVTLQLDDATVETSLRLVAEFVDVKAVRMGNVIFVTDAKRAAAIRKEETHSPSNPGTDARFLERAMPAVGGFGGIALPAGQVPPPPAPPVPEAK